LRTSPSKELLRPKKLTDNMRNSKQEWKLLLGSWNVGPAAQLEHARRYTGCYPQRFEGWIAKADALWMLTRFKEAKAALRIAQRLIPEDRRAEIWEQWGHLYRRMNDFKRAENAFRRAVQARPSTRRHILLGATLARQGKLAAAETQHRAAIREATPREPIDEAHLNLALILRAKERYEEAIKSLRTALRISPQYEEASEVLRDVRRAKALKSAKKPLRPNNRARKNATSMAHSRTRRERQW
jgi:tetratricopeptide (TPR) repeat protein